MAFAWTPLELIDSTSAGFGAQTPGLQVGVGGQGFDLLIRDNARQGTLHRYAGLMAQLDMGLGLTPPITPSGMPGEVSILGYTLALGRIYAGPRGDDSPDPTMLGGRVGACTLKAVAGYGHEITILLFLGNPFASWGSFLGDGAASVAGLFPVGGPLITLFGQTRYITAFLGGVFEVSLSASIGCGGGGIRYAGQGRALPKGGPPRSGSSVPRPG